MWLWLSTRPGTAVRPLRSIVLVHGLSRTPLFPTAVITPFWIVTSDTMEFLASIVAILPLTRRISREPSQREVVCAEALAAEAIETRRTNALIMYRLRTAR